jgi:hypothetical protein
MADDSTESSLDVDPPAQAPPSANADPCAAQLCATCQKPAFDEWQCECVADRFFCCAECQHRFHKGDGCAAELEGAYSIRARQHHDGTDDEGGPAVPIGLADESPADLSGCVHADGTEEVPKECVAFCLLACAHTTRILAFGV